MSTAVELSTSSTRLTGKPDGVTDTRVAASEDLNGTLNTTTTTANGTPFLILVYGLVLTGRSGRGVHNRNGR